MSALSVQTAMRREERPDLVSNISIDWNSVSSLPGVADFRAEREKGMVIDSALTVAEAFSRLSEFCPDEVLANQQLVGVVYYGFDGKLHQGQLVLDSRLVGEVLEVFEVARSCRFPMQSVIPLADKKFWDGSQWSDDASMEAGNGSAFNYRPIAGTGRLSLHALGMAVDLNPHRNPFYAQVKEGESHSHYRLVAPKCGVYDIQQPGTFTLRHPVVEAFESRGWTWGGRWQFPLDLHHFQKIPEGAADYVKRYRP